ncbi:hypothetical protein CP532_2794 [Ophiocordyceps camponoti-leonardi (nom. inval.)]|nr:hypothetical protein CP532_2794 [Ophiocordyceps camponoti-leonardi (nom. inval.)]
MLSKLVAVSAVAASLQGVSAVEFTKTTGELIGRINQWDAFDDACHPEGTWTIGGAKTELMPPCMSEQLIAWYCHEKYLGKNQTDYRDCMVKGSWSKDVIGCIDCKEAQGKFNAATANYWRAGWRFIVKRMKRTVPAGSAWKEFEDNYLHKTAYPASSPQQQTLKETLDLNDYFKDKPEKQGAGDVGNQGAAGAPVPRRLARRQEEEKKAAAAAAAVSDDGSYTELVGIKSEDGSIVMFQETLSKEGDLIDVEPVA